MAPSKQAAKAQPTLASFFAGKKKPKSAPAPAPAANVAAGEELVGCDVEILWESAGEWYSGTVLSFTTQGGHVVDYEDGSNVTHDMSQMQYRVLRSAERQEVAGKRTSKGSAGSATAAATAAATSTATTVASAAMPAAAMPAAAGAAAGAGAPAADAPAALASIFGAAKKPRAASEKSATAPLAPIFGKPVKKRPASAELPARSGAKVKLERPAVAQTVRTQKADPEASAAAKTVAAPSEVAPNPKVADMFLTKKQKQERAKELSLRKLREEQERNRRDDEALNKGKATNPFFEQRAAREPAHRDTDSHLERCDASSPVFMTIPWLLPGGVVHVAQRELTSQPPVRPVLHRDALQDRAELWSHVPVDLRLLTLGEELDGGQISRTASQPVPALPAFSYNPLDEATIEEFAKSLPVIKLLCSESKEYAALKRSDKVLVNTFQRCLSCRYGRARATAETTGSPCARLAHDLWCVMYRPMCAADVCGNRQDVTRLATWLQRMKNNMMTAKEKPKARKYKDDSDSDYESDDFADSSSYSQLSAKDQSELWETSTEYNVVLLSGPAGCGKSAAIHAASQQCGYSIIEMNASEKRTGKAVQVKCGEATQSHGLQKWQGSAAQEKPPEPKNGDSLKRKKADSKLTLKKKAKTAGASTTAASASSDTVAEASLIVFEEIDVLFDDDQGFFAALSTLESTTKRPIVLTSTSTSVEGLPERLPTLNSSFEAPLVKEIRDLLRCICLAEGVDLQVDEAEQLVERFHCDMRALLMDAQMRFQGEGKLLPVGRVGSPGPCLSQWLPLSLQPGCS